MTVLTRLTPVAPGAISDPGIQNANRALTISEIDANFTDLYNFTLGKLSKSGDTLTGTLSIVGDFNLTGNATFNGTAQRFLIKTDGNQSDRFAFQSTATNGNTRLWIYPSGTGNITGIAGHTSSSDFTNYNAFDLAVLGGATQEVRISSNAAGTATAYPITFRIGASEQMRLTSTGLGIGTSSPGAKLHSLATNNPAIFAASDATSLFTTYQYNTSTVCGYIGNGAGIVTGAGAENFGVRAESALIFASGGATERMRLDSSGNLGIGTSSFSLTQLQIRQNTLYAFGINNSNDTQNYAWRIDSGASNALVLGSRTNSTDMLWLSSSGNLGLGVTPSAWEAGIKVFEVGAYSSLWYSNGFTGLSSNGYYNGGWKYKDTAAASKYEQAAGSHFWFTAPSGTAGNAISFTQAMTLDASGNLALGTTSTPTGQASNNRVIQIYGAGTANRAQIHFCNSDTGETATDGSFVGVDTNRHLYLINREAADTIFENNGTERARITSGGDLLVGNTGLVDLGHGGTNKIINVYNSNTSVNSQSHIILLSNASSQADSSIGSISWGLPNAAAASKGVGLIAMQTGGSSTSTNPSGRMVFFTRNTSDANWFERMRITESGDVGIATSPTARLNVYGVGVSNNPCLALDVTSSATFIHAQETFAANITSGQAVLSLIGREGSTKNSAYIGYLYSGTAGSNDNKLTFGHWGNDHLMVMDGIGNVNIGTQNKQTFVSSVETTLTIRGNAANKAAALSLINSTGDCYGGIGVGESVDSMYIGTTTNHPIAFLINGVERAYLQSPGNFLIGRTMRQNNGRVEALAASGEQCFVGQVASDGNSTFQGFSSAGGSATFQVTGSGNMSIAGTLTESSSIAIKENVNPIMNALESIISMNGYVYDRKDGTAKQRAGLIAEEVNEVLPNVVAKDDEGNPIGIQYTNLIAYLVESIKTLNKRIETLEK